MRVTMPLTIRNEFKNIPLMCGVNQVVKTTVTVTLVFSLLKLYVMVC